MSKRGRPPGPAAGTLERANRMAAMYRGGCTLQQIGEHFGVTRERVRQMMTKHLGIRAEDGGKTVSARARREKARAAKEAECLARYGCTLAQMKTLRASPGYPIRKFSAQRKNAHRRGIGWGLNLWQWWTIWQESGRWSERGRGQGYVMCRVSDSGPYEIGNVFIASAIENCSVQKRKKSGLPTGVVRVRSRFVAQRMIGGREYHLGTFATPDEAHAAYLAFHGPVTPVRTSLGQSQEEAP